MNGRRADIIYVESVLLIGGVIAITALIIWVGRKLLAISIPFACAFLLYAATAIPNITPPRIAPSQNACVSYLKVALGFIVIFIMGFAGSVFR